MSELAKTLCTIIKGLREKEGLTLDLFSKKLGISKTSLQNMERGEVNPTLETVEQMAHALGVSPMHLLSEEYDANECRIAWMILKCLECFRELSEEDQRKAIEAFDLLVKILAKKEEGEN